MKKNYAEKNVQGKDKKNLKGVKKNKYINQNEKIDNEEAEENSDI